MTRRTLGAIVLTVGLVVGGFAAAAGAAGSYYTDGFKKLKPVKEPTSCKNEPGITDIEIKVGGIVPTSGPQAASFSSARDGIEARIAKANQEGELGDRKITFDNADDAAETARNLTAAQDLVENQDVFGVIEASSAAAGSGAYLNKQGVPVTGWHVGVADWGKYPNMFSFRNSQPKDPSEEFTTRNADVMRKLGAHKIALVGANVAASATFIEQISKAIAKTKGLKVAYKTTDLTPADREFTGVAQKIKDSGADGLYTGMDFLQNTALNAALDQAGVKLRAVVFPGGYDKRVLSVKGINGVYFGLEFFPFETNPAPFADYSEWMQKAGKAFEGQIPYIGWLSADTFIRGLKEAGLKCPTRKAFIANLRLVDDYSADGAFDPVDFSKAFGKIFPCTYYVRVENGKFVPQFDGKRICARAVIDHGKLRKLQPSELQGV